MLIGGMGMRYIASFSDLFACCFLFPLFIGYLVITIRLVGVAITVVGCAFLEVLWNECRRGGGGVPLLARMEIIGEEEVGEDLIGELFIFVVVSWVLFR